MRTDVYDTNAQTADGGRMHFDVLMPSESRQKAVDHACAWLRSMAINVGEIVVERCQFCHSESSATPQIEDAIARHGYFILQMEGCPNPIC